MLAQLIGEGEDFVADSALVPYLAIRFLKIFFENVSKSSPHYQLFRHVGWLNGISGGSFEQTFSHSGGTRNDEQSHESKGVPLGFSSV